MSLSQSLRNAAFGLGLTFFPSCGSSSSNDCENDFDCREPEVCRQGECANPNEGEAEAEIEYVEHLRETTDSRGEATFAREGREIPVRVEDREGNPLPGINVHYAFKDAQNVLLAVDPEGRFTPDRHIFSGSAPTANVRRKENAGRNERKAGLLNLINFVLDNTDTVGTIVEEATAPHHGDLLEEGEDVNKYCMRREDVLKKTISTPAGLILLAPEAAGMDTTLLRSAIDTPLRNIAEWYIVSRYGQQPGYEVWVPKRATNLCGRDYNNAVCDLSGGQLGRIWNNDLPYWRINSGCVPGESGGSEGETEAEGEAEAEGEGERCHGSPLAALYAWEVYGCHAGTQELADSNCRVALAATSGSDTLTVDGNEFWAKPDRVAEFTRNVSENDYSRCSAQGEVQLCAIDNDSELYLAPVNGDFCGGAGIYRLTDEPWPGLDGCRSRERNRNWYSRCGHDVY